MEHRVPVLDLARLESDADALVDEAGAGHVFDDGNAMSGEAIEERRLTDVGAADQDDDGELPPDLESIAF